MGPSVQPCDPSAEARTSCSPRCPPARPRCPPPWRPSRFPRARRPASPTRRPCRRSQLHQPCWLATPTAFNPTICDQRGIIYDYLSLFIIESQDRERQKKQPEKKKKKKKKKKK